jgi:hypothetical protein
LCLFFPCPILLTSSNHWILSSSNHISPIMPRLLMWQQELGVQTSIKSSFLPLYLQSSSKHSRKHWFCHLLRKQSSYLSSGQWCSIKWRRCAKKLKTLPWPKHRRPVAKRRCRIQSPRKIT